MTRSIGATLAIAVTLALAAAGRAQEDASGASRETTAPQPALTSPATTGEPPSVQAFDAPLPGARSPRNASYDISVRLDHAARQLQGRATVRWRNISAATTDQLLFHLYWNAWRNAESTWMRERRLFPNFTRPRDDAWGSIDLSAVRVRTDGVATDVTSEIRYLAPDDGNAADRTVMGIPAGRTIGPNDSVEVELEWTARIPRPFARTGYIDDYYFIAQWFPKIAVLEDGGWNAHQFHAVSEFYADFGVYDVEITVPRGFLVGASGREVARRDNTDGTATFEFHGEDIHDFAWTASPRFLEARRTFTHLTLPRVEMRLLLQPEHAGQEDRHFEAAAATLRLFGEWFGPYPYDHLTIVDPAWQSGSGGMEYPTLITAGTRWLAPRAVASPETVTVHEAAHQWWYGIVATNEFEAAWMDEGLTMFGEPRVIEAMETPNRLGLRFFGGFIPWVVDDIRLRRETNGNRLPTYRLSAESDAPATPTFRYWPAGASAISYDKTALWLHTLERHLGWPVVQRILSTYFERWKFRHPKPQHLFAIANEIAGEDLTWFFDQVYGDSTIFDYALQELQSQPLDGGMYRTTVVAQRRGEAVFPVDVVTTFEDGHQARERWDGRGRRVIYVYERPARATGAQVDPQRVLLLDVDYTNNSRSLTAQPAATAGRRWAARWMVWLQDLMLTYGFFV